MDEIAVFAPCKRVITTPVFSPVFSPPDKLALYAKKAMEIISKNGPTKNGDISKKSRKQLILLQIELWGKPLTGNNFY